MICTERELKTTGGKPIPLIIGIAGKPDAGKTTLILKLIPELIKRGYRVGTVKNCPHGFDVDKKGKDSWKFSEKGSRGVLLTSQDKVAFIGSRQEKSDGNILDIINSFFMSFDVVLVEGFKEEENLRKIEILRKDVDIKQNLSLKKVIALVSDVPVETDKPVFKPDEIHKIVNFLEKVMQEEKQKTSVEVIINGERIFLNDFMQRMVKSLILGMVVPLRRKDAEDKIREISIKIKET